MKSPFYYPHSAEDVAFSLFAMECEGDLPTPRGKLNKVIKLLREDDTLDIDEALEEVDLDYDDLTNEDIIYIRRNL